MRIKSPGRCGLGVVRVRGIRHGVVVLIDLVPVAVHSGVLGAARVVDVLGDLDVVEGQQWFRPREDHVPEQGAGGDGQRQRPGDLAGDTERQLAPDPRVHRDLPQALLRIAGWPWSGRDRSRLLLDVSSAWTTSRW